MPAPRTDHDEMEKLLRRALSQVSYPTPVQQLDARAAVLSRARHQPAPPPPAIPFWNLFWVRAGSGALFSFLRHALTDDSAFHRAQRGDFGRLISLQYAPSVAFQPMW